MATEPARPITPPYTPELLPVVQEAIEKFLGRRGVNTVLEMGSGWSTVWLAHLTEIVHSVEHDPGWYKSVRTALDEQDRIGHVRVELMDADRIPHYLAFNEDVNQEYDLIIIDGVDEARLAAFLICLHRLTEDGWIVLDDSHWSMFGPVNPLAENLGFKHYTFNGKHTRKTGEVCYHQTTIFTKGQLPEL